MEQRGSVGLAAVLLMASTLAGCADGEIGPPLDDAAAWRSSSAPVSTEGLVWATGSTVHLGDGSTLHTGLPIRAFLVAGDGVFFVPVVDDTEDGRFTGEDLFFAGPDGAAEDTGLDVDNEGVAVSPDGTHLAVLATDYDEGAAQMRLFDLSSGEAITTDDGFDPDPVDPVYDLNESEVSIEGMTDDEVYAGTTGGYFAYALDTGEARELDPVEEIPGRSLDPLVGPDGDWRIEQVRGPRDVLVPTSGRVVSPATGTQRWTLRSWLDADTALGFAIGPDETLALITCRVPSGACETVPGTKGKRVLLPLRTTP